MDYYTILGVKAEATQLEIKKAYRQLSMRYHPDRPNGDKEKFQKISEAYEILCDEGKRKMYDMQKKNPFFGGNMPDGMENNIFQMLFGMGGMPFMGGGGVNPQVQFFHNGIPVNLQQRLQKPTPIVKTIIISLEQAYSGFNYPLEIERWVQNGESKFTEKEKIYVDIPPGIDTNEILKNQ